MPRPGVICLSVSGGQGLQTEHVSRYRAPGLFWLLPGFTRPATQLSPVGVKRSHSTGVPRQGSYVHVCLCVCVCVCVGVCVRVRVCV